MAYGKDEQHYQLAFPKPSQYFTPGVILLLALMILGYIIASYADEWTGQWLILHPAAAGLLRGRLWTLVTYSFINPCGTPMILNCLGILLIGSAIEREWKMKSLFLLWLVVGVTCGIVWSAASLIASFFTESPMFIHPAAGAASCIYGLFGAFGLIFRKQKVLSIFFVFEAQVFTWLVIAVGLILAIRNPLSAIFVGGAGVAYFYVKFLWRKQSGWRRKPPKDAGRFAEID